MLLELSLSFKLTGLEWFNFKSTQRILFARSYLSQNKIGAFLDSSSAKKKILGHMVMQCMGTIFKVDSEKYSKHFCQSVNVAC